MIKPLLALSFISVFAYAQNQSNDLLLEASVSTFNATSNEYAYSGSHTNSELIWKADNVLMLGLGLQYMATNQIALYASYKQNVGTGDGTLDDYDWLNPSMPNTWTDWSHHDTTDVNKVQLLDIGLAYTFPGLAPSWSLGISLGYKQEKQEFKAYGGDFIYSSGGGFRNDTFTLPNSVLGITYTQTYNIPYVGASVGKRFTHIGFDAEVLYSPFAQPEFSDTHHLRSFTSTSSFDTTTMVAAKVGLAYIINHQNELTLRYEMTRYESVRGDDTWQYDSGRSITYANAAGLESNNSLLSLVYTHRFMGH